MTQYLVLIQSNTATQVPPEEWGDFFVEARGSGMFKGGSEIGDRILIGNPDSAGSSGHIAGYMRFDSDDRGKLETLLERHPVVLHGGTIELCELPQSP